MRNILTIDCEDWYHTATAKRNFLGDANLLEERICENIDVLLDLFQQYNVHSTFFVLGVLAERHPELIKKIAGLGHNVGSHGYEHLNMGSLGRERFEKDLKKNSSVLSQLARQKIVSFRAPNWSFNNQCSWAFDLLKEYGYVYDSSFKNDTYLKKNSDSKGLIEIPRSGMSIFNWHIPFGGAFLRLLPFEMILQGMRNFNKRGCPFMVYVHPWELDQKPALLKLRGVDQLILYHNRDKHLLKLRILLDNFRFTSIEKFFDDSEDIKKAEGKLYFKI